MVFVGYVRVSTRDQSPTLQLSALDSAGCERLFTEAASGAGRDRPGLAAALSYLRAGGTLVVWKLDRLARSVRQLVETASALQTREIGLKVLTQQIDTTTPGGRLVFHHSRPGALQTAADLDVPGAHARVGSTGRQGDLLRPLTRL